MFGLKKKTNQKSEDKINPENTITSQELDKNIAIFTMPEQFRFAALKKDGSRIIGLFIVIGGGLFIIVLAVLAYRYLFNTKPQTAVNETANQAQVQQKTNPAPSATSTATAPPPAPVQDPKEAYLDLKREQAISVNSTSTGPTIDEIGEINEAINGNTATLTVKTKDLQQTGTVVMNLNGENWNILTESWFVNSVATSTATSTPESTSTPAQIAGYKPGVDSDANGSPGLTDKEDALLGTNPNSKDSDKDGYDDLTEVENLYNPAGDGKITNNKGIKTYLNKTYNYSVFYPAAWSLDAVGGNDSVLIKSNSDDQFFQIIVQPNAEKQSITNWYENQFNVPAVDPSSVVEGNGWEGIATEGGLIIYLTDAKHNNIYTLTYFPGTENTLDYINLFHLLEKSLTLNQK